MSQAPYKDSVFSSSLGIFHHPLWAKNKDKKGGQGIKGTCFISLSSMSYAHSSPGLIHIEPRGFDLISVLKPYFCGVA